ncbi:MAG: Smr/MutS family protein [Bacteroidetes bacterium]|nr:Smr/MutS family protein [Bacteroidota bacterium]
MKFGLGDIVSFLNEKGGGVITKVINKKMVEVTIDDGFVFPYAVAELVMIKAAERSPEPIPEKEEEKVDVSKLFTQKLHHSDKPKKSKPHAQNNGMLEMEINLHIEELLDNYTGMSNAEIINVQLRYFQKALDKAITGRYRKLVVIHGVGNGRLKQEVRSILDSENMPYYDGSYAKYGYGATEVHI